MIEEEPKEERSEIIFVQVGLSVLSGFIFGFIWSGLLMKSIKEFRKELKILPAYLLSCLVPFVQIAYLLKMRKLILKTAEEKGIEVKLSAVPLVITSLIFPLLFTNVISLAIMQRAMNRILENEDQ